MSTATITSRRPHGSYVKYVVEQCRCEECREGARVYGQRRWRAMHRPDEAWVPYVPAGRAREHVKELSAAGIGPKTIAALSGVPHGSLAKLIYGDPKRRMGPSRRIRPDTERRILSVTVEQVYGAQKIPAGPTWRLLDDLIARGFTRGWIAQQLGAKVPALQISRNLVRASTARRVEELHRRLEGVAAPPRRTRWSS